MSSPLDEDATAASPEAKNDVLRILKIPAAISWKDDNNRPQFLAHDPSAHEHVTFDIYADEDSRTAFFKITANVAYKGKRNKSNVFLFIYPERIQTLASVDDDGSAAARLGAATLSLQFTLATPPSLVVPNGEWIPKNEEAQSALSSLRVLAGKRNFRIALPSRSLSLDRLAILCEKASTSGCLKTMAGVANIAKLYGGQGGRIIEHGVTSNLPELEMSGPAEQTGFNQHQTPESPPLYDELVPPRPPTVKKRRRLDSDAAGSANQEKMSLEDICRYGFVEMGRRFDRIEKSFGDLSSRLDRLEKLVQERPLRESRSDGQENQKLDSLDERIEVVEERMMDVEKKLEAGLDDLAQDVENQLYDVRHEFNDTITVRVEDEMGVAQSQLEDFVKDELRNAASDVEEAVRETLRDALTSHS